MHDKHQHGANDVRSLELNPSAGENAGQESNSQGRSVGEAGTDKLPLPESF